MASDSDLIAKFLAERGTTHCPTVCLLPTQGRPSPKDQAALRDLAFEREIARLEKIGTPAALAKAERMRFGELPPAQPLTPKKQVNVEKRRVPKSVTLERSMADRLEAEARKRGYPSFAQFAGAILEAWLMQNA